MECHDDGRDLGERSPQAGGPARPDQERPAGGRGAGLSTYGYANLVLERVANEAGYTRGALYHLFANKEDLALAVVGWIEETWNAEVGRRADQETHPVDALVAIARGHAAYCRRDVARAMVTLRVEFTGQDHPVGRAISTIVDRLAASCADLIAAARSSGAIPPGHRPQPWHQPFSVLSRQWVSSWPGKPLRYPACRTGGSRPTRSATRSARSRIARRCGCPASR
ncbi:hypothetical protein GCM10029963_75820 [Micromonospora andamanensis]